MKLLIGYKNSSGKYKQSEYTFNNQNHFYNWFKRFTQYNKIISQEEIKE